MIIKIEKTMNNGNVFTLVADPAIGRIIVYGSFYQIYHSQTLFETQCGRLGVHAERSGACYFEIKSAEFTTLRHALNYRTRYCEQQSHEVIDSEFVRANYAHIAVTRRVRERARTVNRTVALQPFQSAAALQSNGLHYQGCVYGYHSTEVKRYFTIDNAILRGQICGFGIELEICHNAGRTPQNEQAVMRAIRDAGLSLENVGVSTDATVEYELVFNAYTIEAWRELFPKIQDLCQRLTDAGFYAEHGNRAGLHIHVSRNYCSTEGDALLIALHAKYAEWFKMLSRRNTYSYCQFRQIALTPQGIQDAKGFWRGHDIAVNNANQATIELRYWRGTLNAERILQRIEFCQQLIDGMKERGAFEILVGTGIKHWFTGKALEYINWAESR